MGESEAAWDWKMQGVDRKRFVCLANLVQAGLQLSFLLHQVCGHPLGPHLPPPSRCYDGFVFLNEYVHRWNARRAERRGGSTPRQPKDGDEKESGLVQEEECDEEVVKEDGMEVEREEAIELRPGGDDEGEEEEEKVKGTDDEDGDRLTQEELEMEEELFAKAKEAIVAGLRPNPNIIKPNERARPSIFKIEVTKQANKKRRRKNRKGGGSEGQNQTSSESGDKTQGADEEGESDRLAVHNSFALLG